MQALFRPAIHLMNRLRYQRKFMLLGAAVGIVMTVLLVTVYSSLQRDITMAEQELAGLQMLKPMNRMTQFMQQHRGLSSGVLNGNEAMREKRAAKEKEVSAALAATEATLSSSLRESAGWKSISQDWATISAEGMGWPTPDNLKRHTAMIAKALVFMADVADESGMILDSAMDTHYFMDSVVSKMPAMLEPLGITRARGTGALAAKELSLDMRRAITGLLQEMTGTLRLQNSNLEKVMRYAPHLEPALSGTTRQFSTDVEKIFALIQSDILEEKFETPPQDYFALTTQVIDQGYKVMFDTLIPQFEQQLNARKTSAQNMLLAQLGLAVVIVLLSLYLSIGTYYSVIGSVEIFSNGARRLAEGDLTAEFTTDGTDELHAAGQDFNNMANTFRHLLGRIKQDVGELHVAVNQLATSSQQISSSTSAQSDSASSMAASVEQMTVGIDHIAQNAQDAQNYSRESDLVAADGGRIVEGVVNEIQGIADTVNQSARVVEELGKQSDQISVIVGTIKDIADQTNLLALNAAIEAARAGEMGRGFAVVADEVRKLAERTTQSTQEIAQMIGAIQAGTSNAVVSMKSGVERVAIGVEHARQAGNTISQVQAHSRKVVDSVSEISVALREEASVSTQIAQNVEHIAQMAEENNAAAAGNAETAQNLRKLAQNLNQEVGRFRT
jgi:methyl-accepting chemotaxis protein